MYSRSILYSQGRKMVRRLKRKGSFTSTNQHNLIHVYVWVAVRYDIFLSPQSDGERRFIIILQCWDLSLAPINTTSLGQALASTTLAGLHCRSVYVCLFACLLVWCSQTDVTYISQPIGKEGLSSFCNAIGQIAITSIL